MGAAGCKLECDFDCGWQRGGAGTVYADALQCGDDLLTNLWGSAGRQRLRLAVFVPGAAAGRGEAGDYW